MKQWQKLNELVVKRFLHAKPTLPAFDESMTFDRLVQSGIPYIPLNIQVPYDTIHSEILNIKTSLKVNPASVRIAL